MSQAFGQLAYFTALKGELPIQFNTVEPGVLGKIVNIAKLAPLALVLSSVAVLLILPWIDLIFIWLVSGWHSD